MAHGNHRHPLVHIDTSDLRQWPAEAGTEGEHKNKVMPATMKRLCERTKTTRCVASPTPYSLRQHHLSLDIYLETPPSWTPGEPATSFQCECKQENPLPRPTRMRMHAPSWLHQRRPQPYIKLRPSPRRGMWAHIPPVRNGCDSHLHLHLHYGWRRRRWERWRWSSGPRAA